MTSKNIVFFITSLDSGGIENYLLRFLQEKSKSFSKVYVYCKSGKGGVLESQYAKFKNVSILKYKLGYFDVISYKELYLFFLKNKISIVCDFTGNFAGLILMTAYQAGVSKRIAFYRGATDHFKKNVARDTYNYIVKSLVKKYATNILSNSKSALNYFYPGLWENDTRFDVIYNGINAFAFVSEKENLKNKFGIPDRAYVIGHTGRYDKAKNHKNIINVAEVLIKKHTDIYFILCGKGVRINLTEVLESKSLASRVLVFENREDIPRFLNTMDCYFFPSLTEGQPNALIEAMIMGLDFVASDIASIKETVGNNYELYNPLDVSVLVNALEKRYLMRSERNIELRNEMLIKFDYKRRFNEFYSVLSK